MTRADLLRKGVPLPFVQRARGERRPDLDGFDDDEDPHGYRKYEDEPLQTRADVDALVEKMRTEMAAVAADREGRRTAGVAGELEPAPPTVAEEATTAELLRVAEPGESVATIPTRGDTEPAPAPAPAAPAGAEPSSTHGPKPARGPIPATWKRAALSSSRATDNLGVPVATEPEPIEADCDDAPPRRRGWIAVAAFALGAIAIGSAAAWAWSMSDDTTPGRATIDPASAEAASQEPAPRPTSNTDESAPPAPESDSAPTPEPSADPSDAPHQPEVRHAEPRDTAPAPEPAASSSDPEPRMRGAKRRTAPVDVDPTPAARIDCAAIRADTERARRSRAWAQLAKLTDRANATCWPSRDAWKRDRVFALYQAGDYERCIDLAGSSRDPRVMRYASLCEAKQGQ